VLLLLLLNYYSPFEKVRLLKFVVGLVEVCSSYAWALFATISSV
jgi:hypothetical protein